MYHQCQIDEILFECYISTKRQTFITFAIGVRPHLSGRTVNWNKCLPVVFFLVINVQSWLKVVQTSNESLLTCLGVYKQEAGHKIVTTFFQWYGSQDSSFDLEMSRDWLSFNVFISVLVLGRKVLLLVLSWILQALVLGLGSLEPCTKLRFFRKVVISPEKPHYFQGFLGVYLRHYSIFYIICSN